MTAYVHRADRSANLAPAAQARHRPRRARREGPDCNALGERLAGDGASLWELRWSPFYGPINGPLVGGGSRKTLNERIGLLGVVMVHALRASAPADSDWSISLKCDPDGSPLRLKMSRGAEECAVPIRLERRSLVIGGRRVFLAGSGATMSALRALAAEMGIFFGAPMRAAEVS